MLKVCFINRLSLIIHQIKYTVSHALSFFMNFKRLDKVKTWLRTEILSIKSLSYIIYYLLLKMVLMDISSPVIGQIGYETRNFYAWSNWSIARP